MTGEPRTVDASLLARMEALAARAWPALETASIDGWRWRSSGGGSKRANSVATHAFTGNDLGAAIVEAERRYAALGRACWFQISRLSAPAGLDAALAERGYVIDEHCTTMAKPVSGGAMPSDVERADAASEAWLEVYLAAQSESRRTINRLIVPRVPQPRAFFSCRRGEQVVATGLCVADDGLAIIECMATCSEARRQGAARAILATIEAWAAGQGARTIFLQATAMNSGAIALYEGEGFRHVDGYHYRVKPAASEHA